MDLFIPIFIAVVILMVVLAMHAHKKEKERAAAIAAWAAGNRLRYHPERVRGFDAEHPAFGFLGQGSNRYAYNIVAGRHRDREITIFDYHYETHSTDSKGHQQTHHHYLSCLLVVPEFPLRPLAIRRETFFDKIKSTFGFHDINFESSEFSRMFHVSGEDRRWCYDVVHNRMMELLLAAPDFAIESDHRKLSVRRSGRWAASDLDTAVGFAHEFLDTIPDHVRRNP